MSNCLEKHKDAEGNNPRDMSQAEKDIWLLAEEEEEEEVIAYSAESSVIEVGGTSGCCRHGVKSGCPIRPTNWTNSSYLA